VAGLCSGECPKGMIAERCGVDMNEAFARLRGYSRAQQRRLSEVADALVAGRLSIGVFASPTRPVDGSAPSTRPASWPRWPLVIWSARVALRSSALAITVYASDPPCKRRARHRQSGRGFMTKVDGNASRFVLEHGDELESGPESLEVLT
jgi:hypothetical protein